MAVVDFLVRLLIIRNPRNEDFGELDWDEVEGYAVVNRSKKNSTSDSANEEESCTNGEAYVDSYCNSTSVYDDIIKNLNSISSEKKNQSPHKPRILRKRNRLAALKKIKSEKFIVCPKFETETVTTDGRTPNLEEPPANSHAELRDDVENDVDVVNVEPQTTNWRKVFKRVRQKRNVWRGGRKRKRRKNQSSGKNHVQSKVSQKTNRKLNSPGRSPSQTSMRDELENLAPSNTSNNSPKIAQTQRSRNTSQVRIQCSLKNRTSTHQDPFSDWPTMQGPQNYATRNHPGRAHRDFMNSTVSPQYLEDSVPESYDVASLLYDLKSHNESVLDSKFMKGKYVDQCTKCGLNLSLKPRLFAKDFLNSSLHTLNCFFCCNSYYDKHSFKSHLGSHILSFLFDCCNHNLGFTLNLNYKVQSLLEKYSSEANRLTDSETKKRAPNLSVAKKHSGKVPSKRIQNEIENVKPGLHRDSTGSNAMADSSGSHHYSPEIFETYSLTSKHWDSNFGLSSTSHYDSDSDADAFQNSVPSQIENSLSTKDCSESGDLPVTTGDTIHGDNHSCDALGGKPSRSIEAIDEKFKTVSDLKPRHFVKLNLESSPVKERPKSSKIATLVKLSKDDLLEHKLRMKFNCLRVPRVVLARMSDRSIEAACNPSLHSNSTESLEESTASDDLKIDAFTWKLKVLCELEKFTNCNDESKDSHACSFKQCQKCCRKFIKHSQIDSISQFGFLYPCGYCFRYFHMKSLFTQHIKITHPFVGPFVCHLCNQECKHWFHFVFHVKLHDINRSLCEKCSISVDYSVSAYSQDDLIRCANTYYDFKQSTEAWPVLRYKKDCAPLQSLHHMSHPSADDILKIIGVEPEANIGSSVAAIISTEEEVANPSTNLSVENLKVRSIMESLPEEEWSNLFRDDQQSLGRVRRLHRNPGGRRKKSTRFNFQQPKNLITSDKNEKASLRNLPKDTSAVREYVNPSIVRTIEGPESLKRFIRGANNASKPGPKSRKQEQVAHTPTKQMMTVESETADKDASSGPHSSADFSNSCVDHISDDTFDSLKLPSPPIESCEKSIFSAESPPFANTSEKVMPTEGNKLRFVRSENSKRKLVAPPRERRRHKGKTLVPKTVRSNNKIEKNLSENEQKSSSSAEKNIKLLSISLTVPCEAKTDLPHCEESFETLSVSSLLDYDDDDYDIEGKNSFLDSLNHCKQILDEDVLCTENSDLTRSRERSSIESILSGTEVIDPSPALPQTNSTDLMHGLNLLSGIASIYSPNLDPEEFFSTEELSEITASLDSLLTTVCETISTDSLIHSVPLSLCPVTGTFRAIDCASPSTEEGESPENFVPCSSIELNESHCSLQLGNALNKVEWSRVEELNGVCSELTADSADNQFSCQSNSTLFCENSEDADQASRAELVSHQQVCSTTWNCFKFNASPHSAVKTCPMMKATEEASFVENSALSSHDLDTDEDNFDSDSDQVDEMQDCNLDLTDEELALLGQPLSTWHITFSKDESTKDKITRSNSSSFNPATSDIDSESDRGASPVIGYQMLDSNALNDENLSTSELSASQTSKSRKSGISHPKVFNPKVLNSEEVVPRNRSPVTCRIDPETLMNFRKAAFKSLHWKWNYIPPDLMDDNEHETCDPPLSSVISSSNEADESALGNSYIEKSRETVDKDGNRNSTRKDQSESKFSNIASKKLISEKSIPEVQNVKSPTKKVSFLKLSGSNFKSRGKDRQSKRHSRNQASRNNRSMKKLMRTKLPALALKTESFEMVPPSPGLGGARHPVKKDLGKRVKDVHSSSFFKSPEGTLSPHGDPKKKDSFCKSSKRNQNPRGALENRNLFRKSTIRTPNPHSDLKNTDTSIESMIGTPNAQDDLKNADSFSKLTGESPNPRSNPKSVDSLSKEENRCDKSKDDLVSESASQIFIKSNLDRLNKAGICLEFADCIPKPKKPPSPIILNCNSKTDEDSVDVTSFVENNLNVESLSRDLSSTISDSKESAQRFSNSIVEVVGFHKLEGNHLEIDSNLSNIEKSCQNLDYAGMEVEISNQRVDESQNTLSKSSGKELLSSTCCKNKDVVFGASRSFCEPDRGSSELSDLSAENSRSELPSMKSDELYPKTCGRLESIEEMTGPRPTEASDDTSDLISHKNDETNDKLVEEARNQNQSVKMLSFQKSSQLIVSSSESSCIKFNDELAKVVGSSDQKVETLTKPKFSESADDSVDNSRFSSSVDKSSNKFSKATDSSIVTVETTPSKTTEHLSDFISRESPSMLTNNSAEQIRFEESVCKGFPVTVFYHNQTSKNSLTLQPLESSDNALDLIECHKIIKSNDEIFRIADNDSRFVEDTSRLKSPEPTNNSSDITNPIRSTDKVNIEFSEAVEMDRHKIENLSQQKSSEATNNLSDSIKSKEGINESDNMLMKEVECDKRTAEDLSAPKSTELTQNSSDQGRAIESICLLNERISAEVDNRSPSASESFEPTDSSSDLMKSSECVDESTKEPMQIVEDRKRSAEDVSASESCKSADNSSGEMKFCESFTINCVRATKTRNSNNPSVTCPSLSAPKSYELTDSLSVVIKPRKPNNDPVIGVDNDSQSVAMLSVEKSPKPITDLSGQPKSHKNLCSIRDQHNREVDNGIQSSEELSCRKSLEPINLNLSAGSVDHMMSNEMQRDGADDSHQSIENLTLTTSTEQVQGGIGDPDRSSGETEIGVSNRLKFLSQTDHQINKSSLVLNSKPSPESLSGKKYTSGVYFDSKNDHRPSKEADGFERPMEHVCSENSVKEGKANASSDEPVDVSPLNSANLSQNLLALNKNAKRFVSEAESVQKQPLLTDEKLDSGYQGELLDTSFGQSDRSQTKNQSCAVSKSELSCPSSSSEIETGESGQAGPLLTVVKRSSSVCSNLKLIQDQNYSCHKTERAIPLKDNNSLSVDLKAEEFESESAQSVTKTEFKRAGRLSFRKKQKCAHIKRRCTKSTANNALSSTLQEVSQIISSLLQNTQSDHNGNGGESMLDEEKLYNPSSADEEGSEGHFENLSQMQEKRFASSSNKNANVDLKISADTLKCNSRKRSKSSHNQFNPDEIRTKLLSRNGGKNTFVCKGLKNRQLHSIRKKRNGVARKLLGDKSPEEEILSSKSNESLEKVNLEDVDGLSIQTALPSKIDSDSDSVNYNLRLSAHPSRIYPSLKERVGATPSKSLKSQNLRLKKFREAKITAGATETLPLQNHLKFSTYSVLSLPETDGLTSCKSSSPCKNIRRNGRCRKLGKWRKGVVKISSGSETENKAQNSSIYNFDPAAECEKSVIKTFSRVQSKPKMNASSALKSKRTQKHSKSSSNFKLKPQKNLRPRSEISKKLRPRLSHLPLNGLTKSLASKSPLVQNKKCRYSARQHVSDSLSESSGSVLPAPVVSDGAKIAVISSFNKSVVSTLLDETESVRTQEQAHSSHSCDSKNSGISSFESPSMNNCIPSLKFEEASAAGSGSNDLALHKEPCKQDELKDDDNGRSNHYQTEQYTAENSDFCLTRRKRKRRLKKLRFVTKKKRGQYKPKPKLPRNSPDMNDASSDVKNENDVQVEKAETDIAKQKKTSPPKVNQRFGRKVVVIEPPLTQSSILTADTCSTSHDLRRCSDLSEARLVTIEKSKVCSNPKKRSRKVKKFRFCTKKKRGQYVPKSRLPELPVGFVGTPVKSRISSALVMNNNDVQMKEVKTNAMKLFSNNVPSLKSPKNLKFNIRSNLRTRKTKVPPTEANQLTGQKIVAFEPALSQSSSCSSLHELENDENQCFDLSETNQVASTKPEANFDRKKRVCRVKRMRFSVKKKRGQYIPKPKLSELPVDPLKGSLLSSLDLKNGNDVESGTNPAEHILNDSSTETIAEKLADSPKKSNQRSESSTDQKGEENQRMEVPSATTVTTLMSNFREGKTFRANRGSRLKELCLMIRVPSLPRKPKVRSSDSSPSTSTAAKVVASARETSESNPNSSHKVKRRKRAGSKRGRNFQRNQSHQTNQSCLVKNVISSASTSNATHVDISPLDPEIKESLSQPEVKIEEPLSQFEAHSDSKVVADFTAAPKTQTVCSGLGRKKRRRRSHTHHLVLRKTPRILRQKQLERGPKSKPNAAPLEISNNNRESEEASVGRILTTSKTDEYTKNVCSEKVDESSKNVAPVAEKPGKSKLRMIRKRKGGPLVSNVSSDNDSSTTSVISSDPVSTSRKHRRFKSIPSRSSSFAGSNLDSSTEINQDSKSIESSMAVSEVPSSKPDSAHDCENSGITGSSRRKKSVRTKRRRDRDTLDEDKDSLNSPANGEEKYLKNPRNRSEEKLSKVGPLTDHKPPKSRKRKQRLSKISINSPKCIKSPKHNSRSSQVNRDTDDSLSSLDSVPVESKFVNEKVNSASVRTSDEVVESFFLKNLPTLKPAFSKKEIVLQGSPTNKNTKDDLKPGVAEDSIPQTVESINENLAKPGVMSEEEKVQKSRRVLSPTTENIAVPSASLGRIPDICLKDHQGDVSSSFQTLKLTSNPSLNANDGIPRSEKLCKEKCNPDVMTSFSSEFTEADSQKAPAKSCFEQLALKAEVSPLQVNNCSSEEGAPSSSDSAKLQSVNNSSSEDGAPSSSDSAKLQRVNNSSSEESAPSSSDSAKLQSVIREKSLPEISRVQSCREEPLTPTKILKLLSETMSPESSPVLKASTEIAGNNSYEKDSAPIKVNEDSACKNTDEEFQHSSIIKESVSTKSVIFSTPLKRARKKLEVSPFADQERSLAQSEQEKNVAFSKSLRVWEDSLFQSNSTRQQSYDSKQTSQSDGYTFTNEPLEHRSEFMTPKLKQDILMDGFKTSSGNLSSSGSSSFRWAEETPINSAASNSKHNNVPTSVTNCHPSHPTLYPQSFNPSNLNNAKHSDFCSSLPSENCNQVYAPIPTFASYPGYTESCIPSFDARSLLYGNDFSSREFDLKGPAITSEAQRHFSSDLAYRPSEVGPETCENVQKIGVPYSSTSGTYYADTFSNASSNAVLSANQESFISNPNEENTYTAL